jgi:hypothetical protein
MVRTGPTPPNGLRPRAGVVRYWLRRPEPTVAVSVPTTAGFLIGAWEKHTWTLLPGAVLCAGWGIFVYLTRGDWRENAEHWRLGYRDVQ